MNDVRLETFERAIRATHGADAALVERVEVVEDFKGERVWEGEVLVFELQGHSEASRCYAWEVDGQVTAVLHTGPIDSPLRAVQASILAEGEPPRVAPGDWITLGDPDGRRDAVVCQEFRPGEAEVVYLDWRDRATNDQALWRAGRWEFESHDAGGGYADRKARLRQFVAQLRRGRFA